MKVIHISSEDEVLYFERRLRNLIMNFGTILQSLDNDLQHLVKQIKSVGLKTISALSSVDFNKSCIQHGLLPVYTLSRPANRVTPEARRAYLHEELTRKEELVAELKHQETQLRAQWNQQDVSPTVRNAVNNVLDTIMEKHSHEARQRIGKKLSTMYGAPLEPSTMKDQFINLSNTDLSPNQRKLLNLGINCHYMNKPKPYSKRIEM